MPIYTYRCNSCGSCQESINTIARRNDVPQCLTCGGQTNLKIVPPRIAPILGGSDFPGYQCPVTDQYVTSRKQRREIIAQYNLVEKG